jgi:hypothetical protein
MKHSAALALAMILAILPAGCVHEHTVSTLEPTASTDHAIARFADGREIKVHAEGGRWVAADPETDLGGMTSYTTFNRRRGLIEGLLVGGLGGAAFGAAVGFAAGDAQCMSPCFFHVDTSARAALGGIVFGGIGVALGAILGHGYGSREVHRLGPSWTF